AKSPLVVDFTFALEGALGPGRGVPLRSFDDDAARAGPILDAIEAGRGRGGLEFLDLPARRDLLRPLARFASARRPATTDVLVIGIGGSSRGAQALAATRRAKGIGAKGRPRLHVLDTVDPAR